MSAHRYWRVLCNANNSNGGTNLLGFLELEFRASIGGADETGSGTASASSTDGGNVAANAFDNSTSTQWYASGAALPQWIKYDFGVGVTKDIVEFAAKPQATQQFQPRDFQLQWSDNDSTWTTLITVTGETNWKGSGVFTVWNADTRYDVGSAGQMWRINMTAEQGGATSFGVCEVEMRLTSGGADQTGSGYAFASSMQNTVNFGAFAAFDNSLDGSLGWLAYDTGEVPSFLIYKFPTAPVEIVEVTILALTSPSNVLAPANFTIDRWDGAAWVTKYTATGLTWTTSETKTFTFGTPAGARPAMFVCT